MFLQKLIKARFAGLWLALILVVLSTSGCGTFVANRIAQAPNTYPTFFAPKARVSLGLTPKMLSAFPSHYVQVGNPSAKVFYRVINPADYHLSVTATNWVENKEQQYDFTFRADIPAKSNEWTQTPKGTLVLLHGYGLAQFSMAPWALKLAQDGWRCVLVDLRGHGRSTGKKIYFGTRETSDLKLVLDRLSADGQLIGPVAAMGESYGAALALRWASVDSRVKSVVAIAPYGVLSNAVLNIARDYAGWMPEGIIRSGLRKLPRVLEVKPDELNTTTVLRRFPETALFIAGGEDRIAPPEVVKKLSKLAKPGSELIIVPHATHEAVTYFFDQLAPPVTAWIDRETQPAGPVVNKGSNQQAQEPVKGSRANRQL